MKKRRIRTVFIILACIILLGVCIKPITGAIFAAESKIYIAKKYDISIKDIKTKKVIPSELYFQDGGLPIKLLEQSIAVADFDYKGKQFKVCGKLTTPYEDDYQLDEISELSAEYLKERVNENICGYCVFSHESQQITLRTGSKVDKNSIESFLQFTGYPKRIYIRVDDPVNAAKTLDGKEIYDQLCNICHTDADWVTVYLIDDTVELKLCEKETKKYSRELGSYYGVDFDVAQTDEVQKGENKHIQILHYND
ncbi:MAG: hypothetical protein IJI47_02205 [Eubacterium sp.]|nr:hypothetical protein [Eubacterium sp.]